jgi:hypothetical protein
MREIYREGFTEGDQSSARRAAQRPLAPVQDTKSGRSGLARGRVKDATHHEQIPISRIERESFVEVGKRPIRLITELREAATLAEGVDVLWAESKGFIQVGERTFRIAVSVRAQSLFATYFAGFVGMLVRTIPISCRSLSR